MELALRTRLDCVSSLDERAKILDSPISLETFLRDVEGRAFRIALMHLRDRDDALDVVQDAMIRLARRYSDTPSEEWPPLFYRILLNRVRDWQRRRAVRNRVVSFFGGVPDEEHGRNPLLEAPSAASEAPLEQAVRERALAALEQALGRLPARQREAFLLRNLEGLDVPATAVAMGCSQGSVKTHYFRAVHRLRELLGEHWG